MDLTRRAALALPVLLVAACTEDSPSPPSPPVDPDVALVAAAVAREQALLGAYAGLARATPRSARLLTALSLDHETHLAELTTALPASGTPTPTPTGAPAPRVTLPAVRRLLRTTERAHADAVLLASPRLAPVLASLAACEASHLVLL